MNDRLIKDRFECLGLVKDPNTGQLTNGHITLEGYDAESSTYAYFDEAGEMSLVKTEKDLLDLMQKEYKKRYFLVAYTYVDGKDNGIGRTMVTTRDNRFVNEQRLIEQLKKDTVIITNIIELPVQDYKNFLE